MMLALVLVLMLFTVPVMAEEESSDETDAIGYLSYLNQSEEDAESRREAIVPAILYLENQGVIESDEPGTHRNVVFYDSLDAMQMGLMSGDDYIQRDMPEGTVITAPYYTDLNVVVKLK